MCIRAIMDETHATYGPYRDGDKPEFNMDPAEATVSFDIFDYEIRDSRLVPYKYNTASYHIEPENDTPRWCVIDSYGKVGDYVKNLYFTFTVKHADTVQPSVDDEVNHPKHYTGRKADLECIMFTELMPSLAANAFKYVWRCDDKGNKTEDLEKALWYLERAINAHYDEAVRGRKVRRLMLNALNGSDFDDWHELVLGAIIDGAYRKAYNAISGLLGEPSYPVDTSIF